jgi:hypothetical protein
MTIFPNPHPIAALDVAEMMMKHMIKVFGSTSNMKELPALVMDHGDAMGEYPLSMGALGNSVTLVHVKLRRCR